MNYATIKLATCLHSEMLRRKILQTAIDVLLNLIRTIPQKIHKESVFDAEVFHRMQEVHKALLRQNKLIAFARARCERA